MRAYGLAAVAATALACSAGAMAQAGAPPAAGGATPPAAASARPAGDCATGLPGGSRATSSGHTVAWRADPPKIPVGRHFAIDLLVCAKGGGAVAPAVAVDARMPSHGHGMNYKASLKPLGDNRYRAEGLMFHMPGQWELAFDLKAGDKVERAVQVVTVR